MLMASSSVITNNNHMKKDYPLSYCKEKIKAGWVSDYEQFRCVYALQIVGFFFNNNKKQKNIKREWEGRL